MCQLVVPPVTRTFSHFPLSLVTSDLLSAHACHTEGIVWLKLNQSVSSTDTQLVRWCNRATPDRGQQVVPSWGATHFIWSWIINTHTHTEECVYFQHILHESWSDSLWFPKKQRDRTDVSITFHNKSLGLCLLLLQQPETGIQCHL